ncbi:MAG TPA: nucleotidyl transferase AbiEii/AbiGii toxin family protein, partial [Longimicrobiales bacterium]|nr:nucleotidyl transferase AbiEii/AbiGii toxin family protein [Longimicrobiales bacterium]
MNIELPSAMTVVLATLIKNKVRSLLMGGQACVVYGGSEFSRDIDIAIYANPANLIRLRSALAELQATVIAVPPFTEDVLARGHSVHFRCAAADGIRLDVMSRMRNVPPFPECWSRRSIVSIEGAGDVDVLGIEDLVAAKKTRRDKDWPVVRKLVDVHYAEFGSEPTEQRVRFWLRELRTPEVLLDMVRRAPEIATEIAA